METYESTAASLQAIEQGQVKAWTRYPATPAWFYPVIGLAEGVLSIIVPLGDIHPAIMVGASIVAAVMAGAAIGSYRKLRGQTPFRNIPHELRRPVIVAIAVFMVGYGALVAISFTPVWPANPVLGAVLAGIGGIAYERRYRSAADRAERRVGLQ